MYMKAIHVAFEDAEIVRLEAKKGKNTWHDFILQIAGVPIGKLQTLKEWE